MITDIFLESTKDEKDKQKTCTEPLFEKRWAGIKTYTYETLEKDSDGKIVTTKAEAKVGPMSGNHFADDVSICSVRGKKSWAESYNGVGAGQALFCEEGFIPCSEQAK